MPARLITEVSPQDWLEGRTQGWNHQPWGMSSSLHGKVEHRVITGPDGKVRLDRPVMHEAPHVIVCAYGRDGGDTLRLGLVKENRDTAAPLDGKTSVAYWGPPRGFRREGEDPVVAARRVVGEEAGGKVCLSAKLIGDNFITNETTTSSFSPIVAIEIDLRQLGKIRFNRNEKFYGAEWFTAHYLRQMIYSGTYDGAETRSMVFITVSTLFELYCD